MGVIVVRLASGTANLWESQVDAKGKGFVGKIRLEFVNDLDGCK